MHWTRGARRQSAVHTTDRGNSDSSPAKWSRKLWIERPVGKFCVGFLAFVAAEVLVLLTLHGIFHFI